MVTSNNKKVKNNQAWLPCEPLPLATSATSATVSASDGSGGDIYYLNALAFYKYDVTSKAYVKLQSPNLTPATRISMSYSKREGHRGNCLGAGANTMVIAGVPNISLNDFTIRITSGTGEGQERTITATGDSVILDSGIATSASVNSISDTTKRWEINQHIGKSVRIPYNLGASQIRKVLYNDTNTLYFYDINYQQLDPWNNTPFNAVSPYVAPAVTAGSQTMYYIEQKTITVDTNWTTTPDATSSYCIESGGIWMFTSQASGNGVLQFYDKLVDQWITKTALGSIIPAQIGTDFSITHIKDIADPFISGGAIVSGTANTITIGAITPTLYENMRLVVTNPATGIKQKRRIVGQTATVIQVEVPFDTTPDNTYKFDIMPDPNTLYLIGHGASPIYQYNIEKDFWTNASVHYVGQCCNITATYGGQEPYGVSSIARNTGGITVLNATPTAGGTGYAVGDLFNITTGGTVGKGRVEAISAGGVVTSVSLYSAGLNYTTGAGKATTIISGGGNNGLTVNITSVGTVGRVTTVANTNLYKGDSITIAGCNESAWNTSYSILAIDSLTTFDIITTATLTAVATSSQSTTVVVDASKNFPNLAGKILVLMTAGQVPTTQFRKITSNTAIAITVPTITAGINGTSRYFICDINAFGRDTQFKAIDKLPFGYATSGSATTLVDTTKNWAVDQWNGYKMNILSGAGYLVGEVTITTSTANQLNFSSIGVAVDATTRYQIQDTFGTATGTFATTTLQDTTKKWVVNQWAGKYVLLTSGAGQRTIGLIASNTANILTYSAITLCDATTTYTILGNPPFSTGIELLHLFNTTVNKGIKLLSWRGGATNTLHEFCICKELWDFTKFYAPQTETLNSGSYYAYDGEDKVYFSPSVATGITQFVFYLDLKDGKVKSIGAVPITQLAPLIGNRMEILEDEEGTKWLYHCRNTGIEMLRCPLWI